MLYLITTPIFVNIPRLNRIHPNFRVFLPEVSRLKEIRASLVPQRSSYFMSLDKP